jgi:6-phosphogluconate dehydrogenase
MEYGRARFLPDRDHRRYLHRPRRRGGTPLLDKVLDAAGQKGTGKWTGINALELGIP